MPNSGGMTIGKTHSTLLGRNFEFYKGALYSVNPSISCWLEDLFIVNERVSLYGEWVHGFFSYTAVGATMVGSIKVPVPVQF